MATSTTLQALTIFCVLALLTGDVQGRRQCFPFSCGHLHDIQYPFRRHGDPRRCGVPSYELVCSDSKATIQINTGTYYVTNISYTDETFWIIDANLDMYSSCPLPHWDQLPYLDGLLLSHRRRMLAPAAGTSATFVNCSRQVKNNSMYRPVACLSTGNAFVYVLTAMRSYMVHYLEPSCGYLAAIPLGGMRDMAVPDNSSYADVVKFMRSGFAVFFPFYTSFSDCLEFREFQRSPRVRGGFSELVVMANASIPIRILTTISTYDYDVLRCLLEVAGVPYGYGWLIGITLWCVKWFAVLCRFALAPLAVLIFLAHKYWKTRITIDAVEKFLRTQEMLGPTRYAYTDITAITSHFRDKLGQGGYGSVYKGVLLPGQIHVAVKMLSNSSCDGEDFISEVATIGRIHHVNVTRLVGFCSEELRRALVYEYMPGGSLDKYIFSPDKSLSWEKLDEIALGIARGINYLHQGCEMQILHFDIKPHNILLDSNFVPKVSDFGLAKLYPRDGSFVPASVLRGTVGYIAPEMISRSFGAISSKSDVYSFGMLLLEIAGGRRNADENAANSSQAYYPSWVYDRLIQQQEAAGEISAVSEMHELGRKLCIVGLWCIQVKPDDRPTMSEVIEMLECGVVGLQLPSRPFFCDEGNDTAADPHHFSSELTTICDDEEDT